MARESRTFWSVLDGKTTAARMKHKFQFLKVILPGFGSVSSERSQVDEEEAIPLY
jgi:hypothetical protein